MSEHVLVQLSDIHLSPSRPFFQFNFEIALEEIARIRPDRVVVTGDLALNGPDDPADIAFARQSLARIGCPVSVVPGNHDVGLVPFEGGLHQPVNPARLQAWADVFGDDGFVEELGDWLLVGLNSQLLGSGLDEERDQTGWLAAVLAENDRPAALFLHYPLFLEHDDETADTHACVRPAARADLLKLLDASGRVQVVASGHLHQTRRIERNGVAHLWAPATAFIQSGGGDHDHGGRHAVGFLVHRFRDGAHEVETVEPRWMINHDIRTWAEARPHGYYEIVKRPWGAVPALEAV